jgi:hypothetical protein
MLRLKYSDVIVDSFTDVCGKLSETIEGVTFFLKSIVLSYLINIRFG